MKRASQVSAKKPYHPPKLIVYGDLTQLTMAGGKMGATDNIVKPPTRS
jgi:hypothetical protein